MLTQLNLRGIQETLPIEDVMTDLDPVEAPVETDAAPRKPAHDERWGTRILLGTATALTLWFFNTSALRYLTLSRDSYGIFWPRREWLFVHVVAGTLAALVLGTGSVLAWTEAEIPDASSSPGWSLRRQRRHRGRVVRGSIITFCRFGEPLHFTPKSDCFWDEHRVSHLSEVTI